MEQGVFWWRHLSLRPDSERPRPSQPEPGSVGVSRWTGVPPDPSRKAVSVERVVVSRSHTSSREVWWGRRNDGPGTS